ncbi:uncharacterized protein LOC113271787 isoform X1 [Papaver somniferum]|uniref:uncharacterized protein LOC113271787 isoform X1 n=1 Tax=Papaver somniferum TaxID=3469 RepID=UPI000E6F5498|nr:uncharacterized protein LOC113271787 isoform X1 [Papaver somniferum]
MILLRSKKTHGKRLFLVSKIDTLLDTFLSTLYFYHLERDAIDLKSFEKELRRRVGLQDNVVPGGRGSTIWLLGNILYPKKNISPVRRSPDLRFLLEEAPNLKLKLRLINNKVPLHIRSCFRTY